VIFVAGQIQVQCFSDLGLELIQAADVTHNLSRHVHEALCIGIIEKGARECQVHGAKYLAAAGQISLVNAGEIHACASAEGMPYSYRVLCLDESGIEKLCRRYDDSEVRTPYFKNTIINDPVCFASIIRLSDLLTKAVAKLEKETLLMEMFTGLMLRHALDKTQLRVSGQEDNMVRQVREYVAAHCTEEISLECLSGLVNFSPYYLHRVFTAQVGIPLHTYQLLLRINRAKDLLLQGKSYAMTAVETGFVDQSHFSRRFKEVVGLTPGQWRQARMAN
jgi:AraC-like DNA-binding protein